MNPAEGNENGTGSSQAETPNSKEALVHPITWADEVSKLHKYILRTCHRCYVLGQVDCISESNQILLQHYLVGVCIASACKQTRVPKEANTLLPSKQDDRATRSRRIFLFFIIDTHLTGQV